MSTCLIVQLPLQVCKSPCQDFADCGAVAFKAINGQATTGCCMTPHVLASAVWDDPEEFQPERFPLDGPVPNEQNTDYRYIPFSAGPRCVP